MPTPMPTAKIAPAIASLVEVPLSFESVGGVFRVEEDLRLAIDDKLGLFFRLTEIAEMLGSLLNKPFQS